MAARRAIIPLEYLPTGFVIVLDGELAVPCTRNPL